MRTKLRRNAKFIIFTLSAIYNIIGKLSHAQII